MDFVKQSSNPKYVFILIACVFIAMLPGFTGWGAALPEQNLNDSQFEHISTGTEDLK
jgi:hypothetical protein